METALSPEKQALVSTFVEIAVGQSTATAEKYLRMANWKLDEAMQLYFAVSVEDDAAAARDEIRAPLPVKREALYQYDIAELQISEDSSRRQAGWESDQNASSSRTASGGRRNGRLASLYRPPLALMFNGVFQQAKSEASHQDRWLLVNLQSINEFSSHMLNRDTWANETVAEAIRSSFVFWQVYHDTVEGMKVCTYYNLVSVPSVLVIDPITGQKMRSWSGMVQAERLLEDLLPFMEKAPNAHLALPRKLPRPVSDDLQNKDGEENEELLLALAASMEDKKQEALIREEDAETGSGEKVVYPPLPEEPKGNRELISRIGIRLPNGRRVQRSFLKSDSIKLLWSFCSSQLGEEERARLFCFALSIPGVSKTIEFESDLTFEESGLSNSMVSLTWI